MTITILCDKPVTTIAKELGDVTHENHVHSTLAKQEEKETHPINPLQTNITYIRVGHVRQCCVPDDSKIERFSFFGHDIVIERRFRRGWRGRGSRRNAGRGRERR